MVQDGSGGARHVANRAWDGDSDPTDKMRGWLRLPGQLCWI